MNVPYLNQPCERCGSKKVVTKVRKATLHNLSGTSKIEYSMITCTDKNCQKEFELNLAEKVMKDQAIKLKREEAKAARAKDQSFILKLDN